MTTINDKEYSKKIKNVDLIRISNGPFTEATFSKNNSPNQGYNHENDYAKVSDNEVVVSTNTGQQKTLNQLPDDGQHMPSFHFVIPTPDNKISKVTFTFVKPPFTPLTGDFLKQFNVSHMKDILRYYFKRVPEEHSSKLVLQGEGKRDAKKLNDDSQLISELGDNPNITVNIVKNPSSKPISKAAAAPASVASLAVSTKDFKVPEASDMTNPQAGTAMGAIAPHPSTPTRNSSSPGLDNGWVWEQYMNKPGTDAAAATDAYPEPIIESLGYLNDSHILREFKQGGARHKSNKNKRTRPNSKKNKRTRRKSLKKQQHRRK